uniref:Neutral ceramidase n=1 Tax=Tanacetum cinerariifolium TaxID=118510 RepID=A0A699IZU6_TANCI|nr:neutral ceramidase [Tanacetum cinerariifolium]
MVILSGCGPRFSNVNKSIRTCPAAMGFAFAAGTTDRPGAFDFTQGDDQLVGVLLKKPDEKQIKGQDPKPILIYSGEMHEPYDWALYVRVNKKRMLLIGFTDVDILYVEHVAYSNGLSSVDFSFSLLPDENDKTDQ